MKKFLCNLIAGCLAFASLIPATFACVTASAETDFSGQTLRIFNWEDYISAPDKSDVTDETPDVIKNFEEKYNCKVEYSTFGTNEIMYNELKINKNSCDLVCPSDYMIMKMINENMVEEFSDDFIANSTYINNVSPYIKELFDDNGWTKYAAAYMWGTMGYMYDPDTIYDYAPMDSWGSLWNIMYENKFTIKDSVRDSYFLGLAYVYSAELNLLAEKYENNEITAKEYNKEITKIMNRTDDESIAKVSEVLTALKKSLFGFEVDSGKTDMVSGKISINFCWSGDAAYSIYEAKEVDGKTLCYSVPKECSNVWFDGWVMPKGAQKPLAEAFINFVSESENAIANMDFIGYTSAIATDEVFEYITDSYGAEENAENTTTYDLGYLFAGEDYVGADYQFTTDIGNLNGALLAQYPTKEVITRCAVMQFFNDEDDEKVNAMWSNVKGYEIPIWVWIIIPSVIVVGVGVFLIIKFKDNIFSRKAKKGYTVVKKG